jgi:hypothetical protein
LIVTWVFPSDLLTLLLTIEKPPRPGRGRLHSRQTGFCFRVWTLCRGQHDKRIEKLDDKRNNHVDLVASTVASRATLVWSSLGEAGPSFSLLHCLTLSMELSSSAGEPLGAGGLQTYVC